MQNIGSAILSTRTNFNLQKPFMNAPTGPIAPIAPIAHNVKRLSHMELPGSGQVYAEGSYAYLGHLTNAEKLGTTILDIADPKKIRFEVFGGLFAGHQPALTGLAHPTNRVCHLTKLSAPVAPTQNAGTQ